MLGLLKMLGLQGLRREEVGDNREGAMASEAIEADMTLAELAAITMLVIGKMMGAAGEGGQQESRMSVARRRPHRGEGGAAGGEG